MVAHQASLPMEFSWQDYCSGLPFPSPGDLPDPGIEPGSPALQANSLPYGKKATREAHFIWTIGNMLKAGGALSRGDPSRKCNELQGDSLVRIDGMRVNITGAGDRSRI